MKPSVFLSTVVCGLLAIPAIASAQDQPWLKDRRYTEGPGYRVGDFEIHPGAAIEFGYDSNYMRRSAADATSDPTTSPLPSLRLRLTPSVSFSTLGAQRRETAPSTTQPSVDFRGGVSLTYNEFIPVTSGSSIDKQRNVGGSVDLALGILPGRPWSGQLSASFSRILTSSVEGASSSFASQGTLIRDVPRVGAEIIWTPGAGLFEWRLGYQFSSTLFESSDVSNLTNFQHQIEMRGRWRFLPRTSLIYDARFGFSSFPNAPTSASEIAKSSSHPMRALIGINGLVTPSFALMAMVGWGASFYSAQMLPGTNTPDPAPQNFDSVIGQAEAKWFLTPNPSADPAAASMTLSSISIGFLRDFYDSYLGYYFERDRGYANLSYLYGGRFLIVLDGGAGPILYPQLTALGVNSSFSNIRVDASLFGEYRFKDSLGINATVRYNENFGDQVLTNPGTGVTSHLDFREIEAYLGFRWLM